jgi:hypothetical protein
MFALTSSCPRVLLLRPCYCKPLRRSLIDCLNVCLPVCLCARSPESNRWGRYVAHTALSAQGTTRRRMTEHRQRQRITSSSSQRTIDSTFPMISPRNPRERVFLPSSSSSKTPTPSSTKPTHAFQVSSNANPPTNPSHAHKYTSTHLLRRVSGCERSDLQNW